MVRNEPFETRRSVLAQGGTTLPSVYVARLEIVLLRSRLRLCLGEDRLGEDKGLDLCRILAANRPPRFWQKRIFLIVEDAGLLVSQGARRLNSW